MGSLLACDALALPGPVRRPGPPIHRWSLLSRILGVLIGHAPDIMSGADGEFEDPGMIEQMLLSLLKTLDVEDSDAVSRRVFAKALSDKGLLRDDPRLKALFVALDDAPDGLIPLGDLAGIARLGGKIVMDALSSRIIIPDFAAFTEIITSIFEEVALIDEGEVASYIPQLAMVDRNKFAVAVTTIDGQRFSIGDSEDLFCLQSSCKPVTYAIALQQHGEDKVHSHVGREPSGRSFNEMCLKEIAEEQRDEPHRIAIPHNPCINAGAIMCTSLIHPELDLANRLTHYLQVWGDLCGKNVSFDPTVMMSERATADRNHALAFMMKESGSFEDGINLNETLELYFSTCSVTLTADMMSTAAATLANGGENPLTQKRVFSEDTTRMAMSLMLSCGMYDFSGEWAFTVGVPAKSGVSGVVELVVPNVCGICIWSPLLDRVGNSVKGIKFAELLVERFNFHHLDSHVRSSKINPTNHTESFNDASVLFDLLTAASAGDLGTVQALVARGADVDAADYDKRTALHLAACDGRVEVVQFLLSQGANPSVHDRWNNSPLDDARKLNHGSIIATLEQGTSSYTHKRSSAMSSPH